MFYTCRHFIKKKEKLIDELVSDFHNLFDDKPNSHGQYVHLGHCSASRTFPIGTPLKGCSCQNSSIFHRLKGEVGRQLSILYSILSADDVTIDIPLPKGIHLKREKDKNVGSWYLEDPSTGNMIGGEYFTNAVQAIDYYESQLSLDAKDASTS